MRALLSYNFITLGESNFKNISFSDVLILKTKNFISIFFFPFLESTSSFKHFEKKDNPHSYCISENTDCERLG